MEILIKTNKYQTPITQELKDSLHKEVYDNIMEYLGTVKFIQNLISPNREYIEDRPVMTYEDHDGEIKEYEDGRKLIDITNPHILNKRDLDFFRDRAIFYQKNGKYTTIPPNPNPNSDYAAFWKGEVRKWKYGVVAPSGDWIPGDLYYYWNYSRIWLTEADGNSKSNKRAERRTAFPRPWLGDYLFYHYMEQGKEMGMHGKLLKSRGVGFSFKAASWSPRNLYVYPGSGNPNFHLASEKTFIEGDKGVWGKILDNLDWIANNTPLPKIRSVDRRSGVPEVQLGYDDNYGVRRGLQSSITAISLKDNPDKARGVRGPLIHYEEDGLFPNLEKAWGVNREAVEDGGIAFGYMLAGGTGGVEGKSFAGSEKLFYTPRAFNVYPLPNVFDKNTDGKTECGFFWGAYLSRNKCYDMEIGEPDVIKALVELEQDRFIVKHNSSDPNAVTQAKAERPVTPQEAVMRTEGTVFPVADLKDYLESIVVRKESFLSEHYVGDLIYNGKGEVEWKPNADLYPHRTYETTSDNRTGAVEIFEIPKKNAEGVIPYGRYILGIDPIDADSGGSLFSVLVMDTFTDRIVAEYTGRPRKAVDAYETALKMCIFYNGQANYEMNLKGLFSYFDSRNALHYLCDTPQILRDMEFVKATNQYGNKAKGTRASAQVNSWGRQLQADWMLTRVNSEDDEDKRFKMHTLRGLAYIEECIKWNADGNFDRVSAAGMLFILREDRFKLIQHQKENKDRAIKDLSNDSFFNKNFGSNSYQAMRGEM